MFMISLTSRAVELLSILKILRTQCPDVKMSKLETYRGPSNRV